MQHVNAGPHGLVNGHGIVIGPVGDIRQGGCPDFAHPALPRFIRVDETHLSVFDSNDGQGSVAADVFVAAVRHGMVHIQDIHLHEIRIEGPVFDRLYGKAQLFDRFIDSVSGNRLREVEALQEAAADLLQEAGLFLCFNALCNGSHAQLLGQVNDVGQDVRRPLVLVAQELHVDLQEVEIEILQGVEGGVSAAEVVEPDLVAVPMKVVDMGRDHLLVLRQGRLRDLYGNLPVGDVIFRQDGIDAFVDIRDVQIVAGKVDRGIGIGNALVLAGPHVPADTFEDVEVHLPDPMTGLENGDEVGRAHEAVYGIDPAGQGLGVPDLPVHPVDQGLIIGPDPALFHGLAVVAQDIILQPILLQDIAAVFAEVGVRLVRDEGTGPAGLVQGRDRIFPGILTGIDTGLEVNGPVIDVGPQLFPGLIELLNKVRLPRNDHEVVFRVADTETVSVGGPQDLPRLLQKGIPFFIAVAVVEVVHALDVEKEKGRILAPGEALGQGPLGKGLVVVDIGQVRHGIHVEALVLPVQILIVGVLTAGPGIDQVRIGDDIERFAPGRVIGIFAEENGMIGIVALQAADDRDLVFCSKALRGLDQLSGIVRVHETVALVREIEDELFPFHAEKTAHAVGHEDRLVFTVHKAKGRKGKEGLFDRIFHFIGYCSNIRSHGKPPEMETPFLCAS